ncbi:leucine-rich melanocyte differentiation-associated protein isoform X6 [Columba livia]|uniref:leucine-rich melanocyte differentiation-associated protein isoform X6 n=1 Tax=Columba livia TaxID=8932 RepID=UPI0031BB1CB1
MAGVVVSGAQVSYISQDCEEIPEFLGRKYGRVAKRLDLSFNLLRVFLSHHGAPSWATVGDYPCGAAQKSPRSLEGLKTFSYLEELILDNNLLGNDLRLPRLPHLHTLTLNKNQISELESLLDHLAEVVPSLQYLSLLGNVACPNELVCKEKDEDDYQRYRLLVMLPPLLQRCIIHLCLRDPETLPITEHPIFWLILPEWTLDGLEWCHDASGILGKCRYIYYGKHSEGNRFIRDDQL